MMVGEVIGGDIKGLRGQLIEELTREVVYESTAGLRREQGGWWIGSG